MPDEEEKIIQTVGFLTWYDARENHPTRSEYRLYYNSNEVMSSAEPEDLLVVGLTANDDLVAIVSPNGTTTEKQLLWLFGLHESENKFVVRDLTESKTDLGFAGKYIISSIGVEVEETAPDYVEILLSRYGKQFPSTKEFSAFSRSTVKDVSPVEEPDKTLITWLEREELLFKTLEKEIVREQLHKGFGEDGADVDEFIKLSLSVHNRRKSRAGFSFENNLAVIFSLNKINYSHGVATERNNKPDFIFPGIQEYKNEAFPTTLLAMLGVKTTAKDRWRQVLSEAERIKNKHLITLEPSISKNQTDEMYEQKLQLVIPGPLINSYHPSQQHQIITLKDFINLVSSKQKSKIP